MRNFKTFDDLVFEDWWKSRKHYGRHYFEGKQARMDFDNGYGVSVLFGDHFYSNGIDTYELAVLYGGRLYYNTPVTNDVLGYITKDQVTAAMIEIQKLTK